MGPLSELCLPLTDNVLTMHSSEGGEQQERDYEFPPEQKTTSMAD
jgi:hypothetical protein